MGHLAQLLKKDSPASTFWYGTVAFDVPDLNHKIAVRVPDFAPNRIWRNCRWQSRDDISLPREGDRCVVVFDNRGNPWVIVWWPFSD